MKFRLKTLFALTAVAGVYLFLARLNPWLPVLFTVMFAAPTAAFALNRQWVTRCATVSMAAVLILWICVTTITGIQGWRNDSATFGISAFAIGLNLYGIATPSQPPGYNPMYDGAVLYSVHFSDSKWYLNIYWQGIITTTFLYGIILNLLAHWLERPNQPA